MFYVQDIEKRSHRDSFRFTQNLSFSATCEGSIPDHEAVCSSRCINSASEDEEPSFECRQTASDSVSDIGDEPLEIAASPSLFHEGEDGIEEEEQEVFGRGLDNEIDIEQIEMHQKRTECLLYFQQLITRWHFVLLELLDV